MSHQGLVLGHRYRQTIGMGKFTFSSDDRVGVINDTSTPKGSYSDKTGVNCPMSLNRVH